MSDEPSTALAVLADLPGLGDPGYDATVHAQRTEAFQRAYPEQGEDGTPARQEAAGATEAATVDRFAYFDVAQVVAAEYALRPPPGVEMTDLGQATWDRVRIKAAKLGVDPDDLQELAAEVLAESAKGDADEWFNAQSARAEKQLRKEWGTSFARELSAAKRAIRHWGGEELLRLAERPIPGMPGKRLGDEPAFLRAWANIARMVPFDALPGEVTSPSGTYEPRINAMRKAPGGAEAAKARIKQLESKHPIGQRSKAVDAEIRALYEKAYPDDGEDASRTQVRLA